MSSSNDLTSLAAVKLWLGAQGNNDDALLSALITAVSVAVLDYLGRPPLGVTTYTEDYTTRQDSSLILRQWPVRSVASIVMDGVTITNQAVGFPPANGYLLEPANLGRPQKVTIFGYTFSWTDYGARVTYSAGYAVDNEAQTILAANNYQVTTNQTSLGDLGVTYANGTPLTLVTTAPAAGQYSVSGGTYTFAAADVSKVVLLDYSSPPQPVEHAVKEIIGEAYRRKERIGQTSRQHPNNGGSVTTPFIEMHPVAKMMLSAYQRKMPV